MLEGADKCTENHSQTMDSFSQGSSKPQRYYMSFKMKNPKHSLILFLFYCTEAKLSKHCEEKKMLVFFYLYFQDAARDQRAQHWKWQQGRHKSFQPSGDLSAAFICSFQIQNLYFKQT